LDFDGFYVSNPTVLTALESASNGAHNCYSQGTNYLAYGNSNYEMTQAGMAEADATNAGMWQAQRADDLYNYERNNGRNSQSTAIGVDIEPSYDKRPISNDLPNGANQDGHQLDFDYGSADGCPQSGSGGSCNNGWGVFDVAWASFHGISESMPQMFVSSQPLEWTVVRKAWDAQQPSSYFFSGSTGLSGWPLTAQQGWNALSADNPGLVGTQPGLICFC
jgi:hypothetical protein